MCRGHYFWGVKKSRVQQNWGSIIFRGLTFLRSMRKIGGENVKVSGSEIDSLWGLKSPKWPWFIYGARNCQNSAIYGPSHRQNA